MNVKFENGEVPIWKLRSGVLVRYDGEYCHIDTVYETRDKRMKIVVIGYSTNYNVSPEFVEWLEPF